ncbi:hypothetical protein PBF_05278 [Cytobacillus firmus DS1]|uniref:Uncharacterized protein n=1 Tax=Cytobacillus firmus DS1 TaxID=1307436 RepID=W7LJA2_CYTFI|nr:hypothetical protein PBF_05278 [Cytobacillus firmus DS1]
MILENANAFPSCGVHSRKLIQCPAGGEGAGDPAGEAEELCSSPRKASARSGNQRAPIRSKNIILEISGCRIRLLQKTHGLVIMMTVCF